MAGASKPPSPFVVLMSHTPPLLAFLNKPRDALHFLPEPYLRGKSHTDKKGKKTKTEEKYYCFTLQASLAM